MIEHLTRKTVMTLALIAGLMVGTNASQAEASGKYRCTADKNTVSHYLTVHVLEGKVRSFSYTAGTPVAGAVNSCSVDSRGAKEADVGPGIQSFQTDAGQVLVTRKGKKLDFDFTKVSMSDVCGQSSTIAAHIALTPGLRHCTDVSNRQ